MLATRSEALAEELVDLSAEAGTFAITQTVPDTVALNSALELTEVDVVLLDSGVGPLSALDVARDLTQRFPDTALVLLSEAPDQEVLERALHAGFRGVVGAPLALEDVSSKLEGAGQWSQRLRHRLTERPEDRRGRMLVVAGAKGGVGATTIATHLALEAQLANPDRRICLIDFDLQAGDVKTLLDLTHHRSVDDLIEVAQEVGARHLNDALYAHRSGLRILLPPPQGEHEADITPEVARGILGAIRTRFDLVVADVGSIVTDGGSMATELADEVLLVVTPDVLAMRSGARLLQLWERRRYRKDGITILVNRASRDSEVQPDLIGRVLDLPVLKATIPAAFRDLEDAVNTGVPDRLADGPVRDGLLALSQELQLVRPKKRRTLFSRGSEDTGSAMVEAMGLLPFALVMLLLFWQLIIIGWTYTMGQHAVREGARELAVAGMAGNGRVEQVVRDELPPSMRGGITVRTTVTTVAADIRVPLLAPRWMTPWTLTVQQGTVVEMGL
ncbi:MAG TPA: AAA family ATPase [Euzebya sp.]|nr:AAA family ATPase [Euzebya sp.]